MRRHEQEQKRHGRIDVIDRILLVDLFDPVGIVGGRRKTGCPELGEAQIPQCRSASQLVVLVQFLVEALQQRSRSLELQTPHQNVSNTEGCVIPLSRVPSGDGALERLFREGKRTRIPTVEPKNREDGERSRTKRVVVELLGEPQSGARMCLCDGQPLTHSDHVAEPLM